MEIPENNNPFGNAPSPESGGEGSNEQPRSPGRNETFPDEKQKQAIRYAVLVGQELQLKSPGMADDFRNGMTFEEINEKYHVSDDYDCMPGTARAAVRHAIRGYDGKFNGWSDINEYSGLIDPEEYKDQLKSHKLVSGKRGYEAASPEARRVAFEQAHNTQRENKIGIHSDAVRKRSQETQKQRKTGIHSDAAKKRAREKQKMMGVGIYGGDYETRQAIGRKGMEARGFRILSDEERNLAIELATNPDYRTADGQRRDINKIVAAMNMTFHNNQPVIKKRTIENLFDKIKKKRERQTDENNKTNS